MPSTDSSLNTQPPDVAPSPRYKLATSFEIPNFGINPDYRATGLDFRGPAAYPVRRRLIEPTEARWP
jgi:hypothetical protein